MFIQTEQTPNPNALKFLPGQDIIDGAAVDIKSRDEAVTLSPFATRLFDVPGVEGVFIAQDYVSVTKNDATEWIRIKPLILAVIMDHVGGGMPILHANRVDAQAAEKRAEMDEISQQIDELIDTRIRPAVARDGGDITFSHFEAGIVYVQLRGACSGCPSATITLKSGIENMLKHFIPEVQEVREVDC